MHNLRLHISKTCFVLDSKLTWAVISHGNKNHSILRRIALINSPYCRLRLFLFISYCRLVVEKAKVSFLRQSDRMAWVRPSPSHVVASLDKTLRDDYLCFVALNKQQINVTRIQRNPQEHWVSGNSFAGILHPRSSHYNEKCADRPIVSVWSCPVTGG